MSLSLRVGETKNLTATADDPSGALDPNAVDTWSEDSAGATITVSGTGATASVTGVASGTANVEASATDPDGNTVKSLPFAVTVLAATDAASVTIAETSVAVPA